jgi:hypothetical protein
LKVNAAIKSCHLGCDEINFEGARENSNALKEKINVISLDLNCSKIQDQGAIAISEV